LAGTFLRRSRRYTVLAVTVGVLAAMVGFWGGAGGAGGSPAAVSTAVSASRVSAVAASAPSLVHIGSLPQVKAGVSTGTPSALKDLSPLGEAALEQAKANAALAPHADAVIGATPAGGAGVRTPGGAITGFEGMKDSATICPYFGTGCQPPDHGVASNGAVIVQVVNSSIAMYNGSTGALLSGFPKGAQTFFAVPAPSPANCDSAHRNLPFLSDPRVAWDPVTGRWFAAILQVENAFGIAPSCAFLSAYHVAVSATSSPTGAWHIYHFNTANLVGSGTSAADYTQMGFNSEAIFIGGNQFNQAGSAFNGAWTLAIPKATAEAGGAIGGISGFGGYSASDGTANRLLDTVQPVVSYGDGFGGPAGEILINSFNESITESKVVVWDFSNALKQQGHSQTISGVVVSTKAYSQPPSADNYPKCTNCLETIDNRISATPVYMHGNVYATHDTAVNNGSAVNANVHWVVVEPVLSQTTVAGCTICSTITTGTHLLDNQYLTYGGATDDWFGAIQPDREGNLFMAYEYGSTTFQTSPSSVYISRRATLAAGASWGDSGIFLRVAGNATTNTRWGDYEAVAFEGWGSNGIVFATEYAGAGGDWATHIDRVNYRNLSQK
jgi:hypothetical protein